jgi:hypothetical protein
VGFVVNEVALVEVFLLAVRVSPDQYHSINISYSFIFTNTVQGDSRRKVNVFRGDNIGHCEKKSSHEHVSNSDCTELFESTDLIPLDFCFWGWMKSEIYKTKVARQDELLARIFDAAARIKKCADQLRRRTCDLCTRVAKCTEVGGGIFEHLL